MKPTFAAIAADALLVLHVLFVLFVVVGLALILLGGYRGWAWVRDYRFRLVHALAIAGVVLQSWAGRICPLTTWEMALREKAGQATHDSSFVGYWLGRLLYYEASPVFFVVLYTGFGLLVVLSWWWVRPQLPRRLAWWQNR